MRAITFNLIRDVIDFLDEASTEKVVAQINIYTRFYSQHVQNLLKSPRVVGIVWFGNPSRQWVPANGRVEFEKIDAPHAIDMRLGSNVPRKYAMAALRCPNLKTIHLTPTQGNDYDFDFIKKIPKASTVCVTHARWTTQGQSEEFAAKLINALNDSQNIKHLNLHAVIFGYAIFDNANLPILKHIEWLSFGGLESNELNVLMRSTNLKVIDNYGLQFAKKSTLLKLKNVDYLGRIAYDNNSKSKRSAPSTQILSIASRRNTPSPKTLQSLPHNIISHILPHMTPASISAMSLTSTGMYNMIRKPRIFGGRNFSQEVRRSMLNVPMSFRSQLIRGQTITVNLSDKNFDVSHYHLLAKALKLTRVEYKLVLKISSGPRQSIQTTIVTLNDTLFKCQNIKTLEFNAKLDTAELNIVWQNIGPCPHVTTIVDERHVLQRSVIDGAFPNLERCKLQLIQTNVALQDRVANALKKMPLKELTIMGNGGVFQLCASLPSTLRVLVFENARVDYENIAKLPRLNHLRCGAGATHVVARACELGYFPALRVLHLDETMNRKNTLVTRAFLSDFVIKLKSFRGYVRTTNARRMMSASLIPTLIIEDNHGLNLNSNNNSASV